MALNPQIKEIVIGTRELTTIKLYPLSVADELEMEDIITAAVRAVAKSAEQTEDLAFIGMIVGIVRDNIGRLLKLVAPDLNSDNPLKDVSNMQLAEIVNAVYEVNFGELAQEKNVQGLLKKMSLGSLSAWMKPLPQSVNDTQDTDLDTSSEDHTEKEELPEDS